MPDDEKRTQKQVTQKYKDHLDYYHRPHWFRRIRFVIFAGTVIGTVLLALGFNTLVTDRKAEAFFTTGPLSQNHANLSANCQACHWGATPNLAHLVQLGNAVRHSPGASNPAIDKIRGMLLQGKGQGAGAREQARGLLQAYTRLSALEKMDAACIACHVHQQRLPVSLHGPQAANLQLARYTPEILVVESGTCSGCHREHQGPAPMPRPASETACAGCHNDGKIMTSLVAGGRGARRVKVPDAVPVLAAQNARTREGIIRFLVPEVPGENIKPFHAYSIDHPPFGYESAKLARDGSHIRYNHQRHEQPDVIGKPGDRLNTNAGQLMRCEGCHAPGPDGVSIQPVKFETHCERCHHLDLVIDDLHLVPISIRIPHHDSEKVHAELTDVLLSQAIIIRLAELRTTDGSRLSLDDIKAQLNADMDSIKRHYGDWQERQRRVFYTGDPPQDGAGRPRILGQKALAACTKCHDMTPDRAANWVPSTAPTITPTDIPNRWVNHALFTHAPHQHMKCEDCHADDKYSLTSAHRSTRTADILMPRQILCAECHRPYSEEQMAARATVKPQTVSPSSFETDAERAARQRREGGVKWDCQDCHKFHAPAAALKYAPSLGEIQ